MHISTPGAGTGRTALRPPADRRSAGSRTAWTCAAAACATALGAVLAYAVHGPYTRPGTPGTYAVHGVAWALFALAAFAVIRRVPVRRALWLVWIGAVAFQIVAVSAPPQTSDDAYRYAWDGRVQAAGISPTGTRRRTRPSHTCATTGCSPREPAAAGSNTRSPTAAAPSSTAPTCTPSTRRSRKPGTSASTRRPRPATANPCRSPPHSPGSP
ncbi:hypothetical protein ACU686_42475 [Yinghuangia aomiensis]